jgi:hypothetical protein
MLFFNKRRIHVAFHHEYWEPSHLSTTYLVKSTVKFLTEKQLSKRERLRKTNDIMIATVLIVS